MQHHGKNIFEKIGRVRILLRIRKGMVHPVHDGISPRYQIRRALYSIRQKVKNTLPKLVHGEHFVRSVAVVKKSLEENSAKPMRHEKAKYSHV